MKHANNIVGNVFNGNTNIVCKITQLTAQKKQVIQNQKLKKKDNKLKPKLKNSFKKI